MAREDWEGPSFKGKQEQMVAKDEGGTTGTYGAEAEDFCRD